MGFIEQVNKIQSLLLNYAPIADIYRVDQHNYSFNDMNDMNSLIQEYWGTICKNFINILNKLELYIRSDDSQLCDEDQINEEIFDLIYDYEPISSTIYKKYSTNEREIIAKTNLLLHLYACCVVSNGNPSDITSEGDFKRDLKKRTYYRGESDYNYSLIPSLYRNVEMQNTRETLNYVSFLFKYYRNRNLIQKYSDFNYYSEIDYEFCSIMQHAGCNSPFLDITKDSKVALSVVNCRSVPDTSNWS